MNSTLQCLYRIPDLRTALQQLQPGGAGMGYQATPKRLAEGAKDLFAVSPINSVPLRFHVAKPGRLRLRRVGGGGVHCGHPQVLDQGVNIICYTHCRSRFAE